MRAESYTDLLPIYTGANTIAVVGASADESKSAHKVPAYLQSQGYRIVPVNPNEREVFGARAFPSLHEVDVPVDVVEVFRPSAETPRLVREAVALGAGTVWLQLEIVSEEAAAVADEAGLTIVMDRCMGIVHGELGLGPGVHAWLRERRAD